MAGPKVFVIIVNYNSQKFIRPCLAGLKKQSFKGFKLVVVDNASTDSSLALIRADKVIRNRQNVGFPAAVNQGLKYGLNNGGDYFVLLGFDTRPDRNWLRELADQAKKLTEAGIIQSKILFYPSGQVQSVGNRINWLGMGYPSAKPQKNLDYASGTAMLIKKEVLAKIGYFDEDLMFMEDLDFGKRAREAGFKTKLAPDSLIYHHYQFFRYPKKLYFWFKAYCRYLWKNLNP